MAGFGSAISFAWPALSDARHAFERSLMTKGDRQPGLTGAAWYQLAHDLAPRDPAPGMKLAERLWQQGSGEAAVSVLARYKAPQAQVLRGQYLVRLERFDEAEAILRPVEGYVGGGYNDGSYWLGVALAEQGKVTQAINTFEPPGSMVLVYRTSRVGLLENEVGLAHPNADQGQMSAEEIADGYASNGMIRSAQRVLAANHVTSASSWILRAQLDQALVKVNWQEVEADYQQALAADPTNTEVRQALRQAATRNNDKAELQKLDELESLLPAR